MLSPTDRAIRGAIERIDEGKAPDVAAFESAREEDVLDDVIHIFEIVAETLEAVEGVSDD